MTTTYQTRPVTVEAMQWTGQNTAQLERFTNGRFDAIEPEYREDPDATGALRESRHESWNTIETGWWIINHPKIGFQALRPEDFERDYQPAAPAAPDSELAGAVKALYDQLRNYGPETPAVPAQPLMLVRTEQTCFGCPTTWDAWDEKGTAYHLRFRFGNGTVHTADASEPGGMRLVASFKTSDPMDGDITLGDFVRLAGIIHAPGGIRSCTCRERR